MRCDSSLPSYIYPEMGEDGNKPVERNKLRRREVCVTRDNTYILLKQDQVIYLTV